MTNETIYRGSLLRRWEMSEEGVIGCYKDAIDIRLHSNTVCDAVNTHNDLMLTSEAQKNEYLSALNTYKPMVTVTEEVIEEIEVEGQEEPEILVTYHYSEEEAPLTITVYDPDSNTESVIDNPAWEPYNTAQGVIANTSNTIIAWVKSLDKPVFNYIEPEETDPPKTEEEKQQLYNTALSEYEQKVQEWEGFVQVRNEAYINTAPSFTVVTDGAALYDLTPSQFWALINANDLGTAIDNAFDTMYPNPEDAIAREFARSSFYEASYYRRTDPLFDTMGPIVGLSKAQIDAMWMIAKDLKRD